MIHMYAYIYTHTPLVSILCTYLEVHPSNLTAEDVACAKVAVKAALAPLQQVAPG